MCTHHTRTPYWYFDPLGTTFLYTRAYVFWIFLSTHAYYCIIVCMCTSVYGTHFWSCLDVFFGRLVFVAIVVSVMTVLMISTLLEMLLSPASTFICFSDRDLSILVNSILSIVLAYGGTVSIRSVRLESRRGWNCGNPTIWLITLVTHCFLLFG